VSITKVVVLLTRNLAKLSLQFLNFLRFSRDFTSFSKILLLLEIRFCAEAPGKKRGLAMWPSGMAAGGSSQIQVAPTAVSAGEGGEKG
jgi:hypothetical protein